MTEKVVQNKLKVFLALVTLIFLVLVARLALIQLVQTQQFKTISEQNRIRLVPIPAKRGEVLDRTGKLTIVRDRPVYSVSVAYLGLKDQDPEEVARKLGILLGMKPQEILKAINDKKVRKFEPIKIAVDVPLDVVTKIGENRSELPGVEVNVEPIRDYIYKDFMPHILGYVREITEKQLEKYKDLGYNLGDRFGQAGIENTYQHYLRGVDGDQQIEVDKSQHPVRDLNIKPPAPGNNLILNVDFKVQQAAEQSLDRIMAHLQQTGYPMAKAGAVVLIDVNTGKVLALASKPGYDPNIFNGKMTPAQSEALFGGKDENPFPAFNNRALMGYAPGSTFKMVTGTAVLESKKATVNDSIFDRGSVYLVGRSYKCWRPSGHGTVSLIKAIQVSCNVYFYQMGLRAGVDNLVKYAREYGLGQKTGIDLPNEGQGLAPDAEWKRKLKEPALNKKYDQKEQSIRNHYADLIKKAASEKEKTNLTKRMNTDIKWLKNDYKIERYWEVEWREFETINMSIGQGYNLYTPLQMANYIATIANGGTRYKPYLVDRIVDFKGKTVEQNKPEVVQKVSVSPQTLAYLREGMHLVTKPGGTAAGIFAGFPVDVAGKTGTAQTGKDKNNKDRPNHGWFVGYAPYDKPQVAVAALVEYGGHGGSSAGLVAKDVLAAYFNVEKPQLVSGATSEE